MQDSYSNTQVSLSDMGDTRIESNTSKPADAAVLPLMAVFNVHSGLSLLLSPQLIILGVTDALLTETYTVREEVVGRYLFDIFPDNPATPEASATSNVRGTIELMLATRATQQLDLQQYDIPDPDRPGHFIERYWSAKSIPILDAHGEVICILHETTNITEEIVAKRQLKESAEREQVAMAQAEQQRLRLKRLFDQAPAAFAIFEGPELTFKEINTTYQQLFPGRQLLGLPLFEALPELNKYATGDAIRNVYLTGESLEGKELLIPLARHQGQPEEDIYWNFISQAIYDTDGQISGVLNFALDVTDFVEARRKVERSTEALQKLNSELEERVRQRSAELQKAKAEADRQSKRLNDLFMQAPAAICILDGPDLVYELVNPVYEQLFPGRTFLGRSLVAALPEIKDHYIYKACCEVYQTGITKEASELLVPFARPDDGMMENRYFRYILQARYDEQDKVDGVVVFALEITEQVEARKAAEASEEQLRLVTNALPVLIGYLDKEEKYRFTNKVYEKWFPIKAEALIGRPVKEVVGEASYQNVKHYIDQALAGKTVSFEARMPYREDFLKYIQTTYVPDVKNGVTQGFYTLVTDVTEQVMAREALEESKQKANVMAQQLAVANEELKNAVSALGKYNSELEERVGVRTDELQRANRLLQEQIAAKRKTQESLAQSHEKLKALTTHLQVMREEERKYIARELHDELGQSFTALKIDVSLLLKKLANGNLEQYLLREELHAMMKTINSSIQSMREIVATLRPAVLDNFGLLSEIESQAQEFHRRTLIPAHMITDLEYISLDQEVSIEVFRIIQESMTNIVRHASATEVTITIDRAQQGYYFTIADNGKGMPTEFIPGNRTFGLLGMQERAERIGGKIMFDAAPGKGTKVKLEVPA